MARIRTIKPEMWEDKEFGHLSERAQLLFISAISQADDEGRLRWDPLLMRAKTFPYKEVPEREITAAMTEVAHRLVHVYEVNGEYFAEVLNWRKHQRIDRPQPSALPPHDPDDDTLFDLASLNDSRPIDDRSANNHGTSHAGREGKGMEGKGMDKASARARTNATSFPPNWSPNEGHQAYASTNQINIGFEAERFQNNALANDRRYRDWNAAFRNWLLNVVSWREPKKGVMEQRMDVARQLDAMYAEREHSFEQKELPS